MNCSDPAIIMAKIIMMMSSTTEPALKVNWKRSVGMAQSSTTTPSSRNTTGQSRKMNWKLMNPVNRCTRNSTPKRMSMHPRVRVPTLCVRMAVTFLSALSALAGGFTGGGRAVLGGSLRGLAAHLPGIAALPGLGALGRGGVGCRAVGGGVGAALLRGGAFKPRTSPYDFSGLKGEGIELLKIARQETGLPIVTEIMSVVDLPLFEDVDVLQVGARNMQNFDLLRELGKLRKPILLKRGLANTLKELLMSAEYIMAGGNEQVILCERGIRTFEKATRNTLDLSAVEVVKERSHLPIIVDPSHATGHREMVPAMAMAAIAAGADGIMCEVHNDPEHAWCDGAESITPETFDDLMGRLKQLAPIVGREL